MTLLRRCRPLPKQVFDVQLFRARGTSDLLSALARARRSFTLVIHSARTLHCALRGLRFASAAH